MESGQSQGAIEFALSSEELQQRFQDLEILDLLGFGGMGAVYLARQKRLDRLVALKVLSCSSERYEAFSLRFEQEARLLAKLQHPNIVGLYDLGELEGGGPDGQPLFYFSMEYVEGSDLRVRLRNGKDKDKDKEPMSADVALSIAEQLCGALQCAHEMGVVHRDIKPANILIGPDNTAKIADFGIARIIRNLDDAEDITRLTLTGTTLGTAQYTAPEQWDDLEGVDHRADIFSLGVLLYEMLTGTVAVGVFDAPSHKADVDEAVDALVLRAMNRDPGRRFASAGEMQEALAKVRQKRSGNDRSGRGAAVGGRKLAIGAAVDAALVGLGLWAWSNRNEQGQSPQPVDTNPASASAAVAVDPSATDAQPQSSTAANVCSPGHLRVWGQLDNGNDAAAGLASAAEIGDYAEITANSDGAWAARRRDGSYTTYGFEAFVAGKQWARLDYTHPTCPAGLTSDGHLWCLDSDQPRMICGPNDGDGVVGFATGSHLVYSIDRRGKLGLHFLESAARGLNLDERLVGQIETRLSALKDVVQIRASNTNAIAVTAVGEVISWHLGHGVVPTPAQVVDVVRLDCGAHDYYAVDRRGELMTWSAQIYDSIQLGPPENLDKIVDLRVRLEVCAVQFEDGTWRSWLTRRLSERSSVRYQHGQRLVEKINALGPARDLVFSAKNEGALLYWIEPGDPAP